MSVGSGDMGMTKYGGGIDGYDVKMLITVYQVGVRWWVRGCVGERGIDGV